MIEMSSDRLPDKAAVAVVAVVGIGNNARDSKKDINHGVEGPKIFAILVI